MIFSVKVIYRGDTMTDEEKAVELRKAVWCDKEYSMQNGEEFEAALKEAFEKADEMRIKDKKTLEEQQRKAEKGLKVLNLKKD